MERREDISGRLDVLEGWAGTVEGPEIDGRDLAVRPEGELGLVAGNDGIGEVS